MTNKNSSVSRLVAGMISAVIMFILILLLDYIFLPSLNFHSTGFWLFVLFVTYVAIIVSAIIGNIRKYLAKEEMRLWKIDTTKEKFAKFFSFYPIATIAILFMLIWIVGFLVTAVPAWKMFNAIEYSELLKVENGNFSEDIISANSSDIISVDVKTSQQLGDRTIGNIPNASWYEVSNEYNLISISGEEYRISPLEYSGLFQSLKAGSLPGYVLINAKTQTAKYVELENAMIYSTSAYFSKDLQRHLHRQYPTYIFDKSFFEIDDKGNPYWITSVKTPQIGLRGGLVVKSAVITDAVTGKSTEYAITDLPSWVDHAHSLTYLMKLLHDHYGLQNGYFNFSNTKKYHTAYDYRDRVKEDKNNGQNNEFTPFDGYNSVVTSNGEIMFYTGITPTNRAETIIGFVLISPKTGEAKFYEVSGSEEFSAQAAAEGLVQNLRYSASFPTIINVDGIETYFMTLKDGAGLVQKYALCNVEQYSIVVEADSINEAITKYKNRLKIADIENNNSSDDKTSKETAEIIGTVSRVETAQINGYTYYYFKLDNNNTTFISSIENSNNQPLNLIDNAIVKISYYISDEPDIAIVTSINFNSQ